MRYDLPLARSQSPPEDALPSCNPGRQLNPVLVDSPRVYRVLLLQMRQVSGPERCGLQRARCTRSVPDVIGEANINVARH